MNRPNSLLDLEEALSRISNAIQPPPAPEIRADRDDPATNRSAMDGVALRSADGSAPRRMLGTLFAGDDPAPFPLEAGTCVRIMTGAALPEGADAVVPVERIRVEGDRVLLDQSPRGGDFVRVRGEQARTGDCLLEADRPRTSARTGLLASVGLPVPPLRRVRVGLASTGDEVVVRPAPHQIRDSNAPMLEHLAFALGADVVRLPPVPDDREALAAFLTRARAFQVVLTSGGVSMGERDLLPLALEAAGARLLFHRINLRPGKPMLAALLGPTVFLALPGNPVSACLNAHLFLPPVLARLQGHPVPDPWRACTLLAPVANLDDRPLLHPCRRLPEGLSPLPSKGSADLVRLAQADACVWVPIGGHRGGPAKCFDLI
jgi:molybdopterin molybdotransferase